MPIRVVLAQTSFEEQIAHEVAALKELDIQELRLRWLTQRAAKSAIEMPLSAPWKVDSYPAMPAEALPR